MKEKQIEWLLWKCAVVGSEIEGERGRKEEKETVIDANLIYFCHTRHSRMEAKPWGLKCRCGSRSLAVRWCYTCRPDNMMFTPV
jgi:hypothetical protein